MRDNQVDTCYKSGSCGAGCPNCAAKFEINFVPMDIRKQYMADGVDPKLDGVN